MQALAASCEELRARTGKPPLAFHFCAQATFKVVFKNNPPALENVLFKIILVVTIIADPKQMIPAID
jgi:hypothetical protein